MESKNTQDIVEKRKIIHIDMDAFYASVEQRDKPQYQGKPVVVGGRPEQRGVVAACSYEARKFGIHSAMPSARALQLCPKAVFLKPRFDVYRQVSQTIHEVFHMFTELIEPLSLDEAYLDVSENQQFSGSATLIARELKKQIKLKTGLNASAGVSYNKFLAKIASDMDKPDGLYLITPEEGPDFIRTLPIRKFFGIGKATEAKMNALGIENGEDLRERSLDELLYYFGKVGRFYYQIARGNDPRPVNNQRQRKSIGKETTFHQDIADVERMKAVLDELSEQVAQTLVDKELAANTITLKVKYADFELITRSKTIEEDVESAEQIANVVKGLLDKTDVALRPVRLLGVSISKLHEPHEDVDEQLQQLELL